MSRAISESELSTLAMDGMCMADLLGDEATGPGGRRSRGHAPTSFGTFVPGITKE
jgi:hypothetical protein